MGIAWLHLFVGVVLLAPCAKAFEADFDLGESDAGRADSGRPDMGAPDAAMSDFGMPDEDGGLPERDGGADFGVADAGFAEDLGLMDAGLPDDGGADLGTADAGLDMGPPPPCYLTATCGHGEGPCADATQCRVDHQCTGGVCIDPTVEPACLAAFGVSCDVFEEDLFPGIGDVAVDGERIATGGRIRRRTPTGWIVEADVSAHNGDWSDGFGAAVDLSGDLLVVGAPTEDYYPYCLWPAEWEVGGDCESHPDTGAMYVFRRAGGVWSQEGYVNARISTHSGCYGLGRDVAFTADRGSVVGWLPDCGLAGTSWVQVSHHDGTGWESRVQIMHQGVDAWNEFGRAIATDVGRLLIGHPNNVPQGAGPGRGPNPGAASTFVRQDGRWVLEQQLHAPGELGGDEFGASVDLDGDVLIVGAPGASSRRGRADIYRRVAGSWVHEAALSAANGDLGDVFGRKVAIRGDLAIVTASLEDSSAVGVGGLGSGSDRTNNDRTDSGAVYFYRRGPGGWSEVAFLKGPADATIFGSNLAFDGTTLVVSSRADAGGGQYSVYHIE